MKYYYEDRAGRLLWGEMDKNGQSRLSQHIYNVISEIIRKITEQMLQANGGWNELLPGPFLNTSGMIRKERERSVYLKTSIAKLASMIAERNISMEQWWNDKERRNPKYSKTFLENVSSLRDERPATNTGDMLRPLNYIARA